MSNVNNSHCFQFSVNFYSCSCFRLSVSEFHTLLSTFGLITTKQNLTERGIRGLSSFSKLDVPQQPLPNLPLIILESYHIKEVFLTGAGRTISSCELINLDLPTQLIFDSTQATWCIILVLHY